MNLTPLSVDLFAEPFQVDHPGTPQHSSSPQSPQHSAPLGPSQHSAPDETALSWEGPSSSSTPSHGSKKNSSRQKSENRVRKLREEIGQLKKDILREKRRADRFRKSLKKLKNTNFKAARKRKWKKFSGKVHKDDAVWSYHLGGSRRQATVHTCRVYTAERSKAYATISTSLRHDEWAVWAHLKPVLDEIQSNAPISTVHFMSDGPLTQYRNKKNFFLMSTLPFMRGIEAVTWNFSEKSHGKGAPDGIGGSLKRKADAFVQQGGDIQHPEELFSFLEKSNSDIKLYWVTEEDIARVDEAVPTALPIVKGTLGIHQVITDTPGKISHRELSCFCKRFGVTCECEPPMVFDFNSEKASCTTNQEQEDMAGKMVIVSYDDKPFVGQVLKIVDEEIEVSCMQQSGGKNCFVWPQIPDVIFYFQSDVKAVISEPESSTSRSSRLSAEDWKRFLSV